VKELVVRDPSAPAALVVEVELSATPGRTARLTLDLGYTDAQAVAVTRDLAQGLHSQVEALLADRAIDLPDRLRGALIGLAAAITEQTGDGATVTMLDTPRTRAWRAHPAGRGR
jgi:hypothetical protein